MEDRKIRAGRARIPSLRECRSKKAGMRLIYAATALFAATSLANAADFPTKPISIIAHTEAGSSTDIFARELARAAEPILGQPVVVVNRPGGSGATQMAAIKSAAPDGYTVGVNTTSHLTAWQTNLKGVYSWQDFSWISLNQLDPYVVAVSADSPYKSLQELLESNNGGSKKLNVGGFGTVGAAHNIAFNMLGDAAKADFNWVAYGGGAQAMTALLGSHIDVVNTNPGPVLQFAEAGRIRVLGVMNEERISAFPDVPTMQEAGYEVDNSWKQIRGIYGPKGIPEEIQEKLADAFLKAMESPQFQKYMQETAQIPGNLDPKEYTSFIETQDKIARDWLVKLGITK